ncbi:MAG: PilZ domain-containing protein [Pseudomonadota bacterium]
MRTLGCACRTTSDCHEYFERLHSRSAPNLLLFLDPTVPGFDGRCLRSLFLTDTHLASSKIILVRQHFKDEFFQLEDALDVDGMVARTYDTADLAFVMNYFLFPQQQNRRRHARALATVKARGKIEGTHRHFSSETGDLSAAGVFLRTKSPFDIGTPVELQISLPEISRPILASGSVAYKRTSAASPNLSLYPPGMGIHFEQINLSDRARLTDSLVPRFQRCQRRATDRSML